MRDSDQALTERVAILMAVGNNGGEWATHYTEQQKDHWRDLARQVIRMVKP